MEHRSGPQTERRCGAGPVRGLLGGKDLTGRVVRFHRFLIHTSLGVHTPWQEYPSGHTTPHAPQLELSKSVLVQCPLQRVPPGSQLLHAPTAIRGISGAHVAAGAAVVRIRMSSTCGFRRIRRFGSCFLCTPCRPPGISSVGPFCAICRYQHTCLAPAQAVPFPSVLSIVPAKTAPSQRSDSRRGTDSESSSNRSPMIDQPLLRRQ